MLKMLLLTYILIAIVLAIAFCAVLHATIARLKDDEPDPLADTLAYIAVCILGLIWPITLIGIALYHNPYDDNDEEEDSDHDNPSN